MQFLLSFVYTSQELPSVMGNVSVDSSGIAVNVSVLILAVVVLLAVALLILTLGLAKKRAIEGTTEPKER